MSEPRLRVFPLAGIPEIRPGDDLPAIVAAAYAHSSPTDGDILVVTSKAVSKAEGRAVAAEDRDAAIDAQTVRVVATVERGPVRTRIVENRQGLVLAAAGVDASNVDDGRVLLLPEDPDASARRIRAAIRARTGALVGVIVSDTLGRAWRVGQTDAAIGAAGVVVAEDLRGTTDAHGRVLEATIAAVGDEIAGTADLVKGKAAGLPVAVVRGLDRLVTDVDGPGARALQRPLAEDLFRQGAAEAWREGYQAALADALGDALAEAGTPPERRWTVIVPVKAAALAKSRLGVPDAARGALATAIALDTVEAAAACERVARVIVVTADDGVAAAVAAIGGAETVPDTAADLGAAIAIGLAAAGESADRAVLLGDLPALRPRELSAALALAATAGRAFVPDAEGEGTTLATASAGIPFAPRFGPDSAARHRADGFSELRLPSSWGLRRDVDTAEHLAAAGSIGLGPRTAAIR